MRFTYIKQQHWTWMIDTFLKHRSLICSISKMKHFDWGLGNSDGNFVLAPSDDLTSIRRSRRGSRYWWRESIKASLVMVFLTVSPFCLSSANDIKCSPVWISRKFKFFSHPWISIPTFRLWTYVCNICIVNGTTIVLTWDWVETGKACSRSIWIRQMDAFIFTITCFHPPSW